MKIKKSKPTISQMREWWEQYEEHLEVCDDETANCLGHLRGLKPKAKNTRKFLSVHMRDNKAGLL